MPKKRSNNKLPHHATNIDMHMQNIMEAAKFRQASVAYRHDLLLHHQQINFKNEYDRVRGMLEHTNLPDSSKTRLEARRAHLNNLVNQNLYPSRH